MWGEGTASSIYMQGEGATLKPSNVLMSILGSESQASGVSFE